MSCSFVDTIPVDSDTGHFRRSAVSAHMVPAVDSRDSEDAMTRLAARLLCASTFVIAVLAGAPALAQLDSAALVATVRDSSSAVIPGAMVTATQTTTGGPVSARPNGQGE